MPSHLNDRNVIRRGTGRPERGGYAVSIRRNGGAGGGAGEMEETAFSSAGSGSAPDGTFLCSGASPPAASTRHGSYAPLKPEITSN